MKKYITVNNGILIVTIINLIVSVVNFNKKNQSSSDQVEHLKERIKLKEDIERKNNQIHYYETEKLKKSIFIDSLSVDQIDSLESRMFKS